MAAATSSMSQVMSQDTDVSDETPVVPPSPVIAALVSKGDCLLTLEEARAIVNMSVDDSRLFADWLARRCRTVLAGERKHTMAFHLTHAVGCFVTWAASESSAAYLFRTADPSAEPFDQVLIELGLNANRFIPEVDWRSFADPRQFFAELSTMVPKKLWSLLPRSMQAEAPPGHPLVALTEFLLTTKSEATIREFCKRADCSCVYADKGSRHIVADMAVVKASADKKFPTKDDNDAFDADFESACRGYYHEAWLYIKAAELFGVPISKMKCLGDDPVLGLTSLYGCDKAMNGWCPDPAFEFLKEFTFETKTTFTRKRARV